MKRFYTIILYVHIFLGAVSQDAKYARTIIDTLTSPAMHGRGYVNKGDRISADYISSQFTGFGLQPFGKSFLQPFPISINTFPDTVNLTIDAQQLIPGKDFVLFSSSSSVSGTFNLDWFLADTSKKYPEPLPDFTGKVVITDKPYRDFEKENILHSAGVIFLSEGKVWWHVSNGQAVKDYFQLSIAKEKIPQDAKTITIKVNNHFFKDYQTQNVVGYIPGKKNPDQFFVFTAHYDHLGRMGSETYFPGANDNASGTAMLLDMARYYSQPANQPDQSIVFMAFSAEEVGLLGSDYFAKHPLFPLQNIKFLINLDMVGSGSLGIKVVNGTVFKEAFEKLVKINSRNEYILKVNERGEAANSDHYPFYVKGVPCFFIYTLGDECKEYHNIDDVSANVPLTEYEDVFRLLINFEEQLEKKIK